MVKRSKLEWKGTSGSLPIGHQQLQEKCEIVGFLEIKSSFLSQNICMWVLSGGQT